MPVEVQHLWPSLPNHLPAPTSPPLFTVMCGGVPCLLSSRCQNTSHTSMLKVDEYIIFVNFLKNFLMLKASYWMR